MNIHSTKIELAKIVLDIENPILIEEILNLIQSKSELTEKQKEYLYAIKDSGDALIVLINDILDLAKVDAGKMTFEQTPFNIASSISAMLHLFEPKIQEKNLILIKEYHTVTSHNSSSFGAKSCIA